MKVTELIKSIKIKIEDSQDNCDFIWNIKNKLSMNSEFRKFTISMNISCSLQGHEKITLSITDSKIITDYYNNTLVTTSFSAKALRFKYVSSTEQAATDASGKAFSITSIASLLVIIGINLLQSAAMGSFWSFINMTQLLFYIPTINVLIPSNLRTFLSSYLSVVKIAIPLDVLPDWIPNPLDTLSPFITNPFNSRFLEIGYGTTSFVLNFAEELISWVMIGLTYILLSFLDCVIPEG